MKMSAGDRLGLFLGACVCILAGLLLVILSLTGVLGVPTSQQQSTLARWMLPLVGVLLLLFGGFVLGLLRRLKHKQDSFVVAQSSNGEMRISVRALEDIVRRCVTMQQGIALRDTDIASQRDLVQVSIRITAESGLVLPDAVKQLQLDIQREMLAGAGIKTGEIRVTVDSALQGNLFERRSAKGINERIKTGANDNNQLQEDRDNAGER